VSLRTASKGRCVFFCCILVYTSLRLHRGWTWTEGKSASLGLRVDIIFVNPITDSNVVIIVYLLPLLQLVILEGTRGGPLSSAHIAELVDYLCGVDDIWCVGLKISDGDVVSTERRVGWKDCRALMCVR
jgi:hypothetical protein